MPRHRHRTRDSLLLSHRAFFMAGAARPARSARLCGDSNSIRRVPAFLLDYLHLLDLRRSGISTQEAMGSPTKPGQSRSTAPLSASRVEGASA